MMATFMKVIAFGTLKRSFPLHYGLTDAPFLGEYRTLECYPMLVAGPWFAPMIFNEPGVGHRLLGELYEVDDASLARLDRMESPSLFRDQAEGSVLRPPRALDHDDGLSHEPYRGINRDTGRGLGR